MDNISKPYKHDDKWLVFPNTTLSKLDILDCDDTIWGMCNEDVTLDQCIKECDQLSKYCSFGYHVKTKSGKTLCAPLRTELYPNLNPVNIMANKNIYSEFADADVNVFMNSKVHPFPQNKANTLFYRDIVNIINTESDTSINSDPESLRDNSQIVFTNGERLNVTFFPIDRDSINIAPYIPVLYGDLVNINIANSALVMKKDDETENVVWSQSLGLAMEDFAFRILPISRGQIGEPVAYGDKVAFTYATDGFYLVVDANTGNSLSLHSGDYNRILSMQRYYPTFVIESKMVAYYCDNGMCKNVPVSKLSTNGTSGQYGESLATRLKGCAGMCKYAPQGRFSLSALPHKSEKSNAFVIVVIALLVVIIAIFIRRFLIYRGGR